jgi:hypothetical protein
MNSETVRRLVTEAGHPQLAEQAAALLQPAIKLVARKRAKAPGPWRSGGEEPDRSAEVDAFDAAMAELPLGASRLGGLPDLAPGTSWPEMDGVPMEFLAQLRLDELAPLDPLGRLPRAGSLVFFQNSQFVHNDMEPDAKACAVLFIAPETVLERAVPPRVEWKGEYSPHPQVAPYVFGLATVEAAAFEDLPASKSPFVAKSLAGAWDKLLIQQHKALRPADSGHHVLGYVRDSDFAGAHVNGAKDQLLLELFSDEAADFNFGDADTLRFLLRKDELAAGNFSKVRLYLALG